MRALPLSLKAAFKLAILAIVLLTSNTASAQLQKVITLIKGEVTNADGQPAADVSVGIYKGTEKVFTTKSNKDGKFTATLQPNATYRVTFANSNYQFREQTLAIPALERYQETPLRVSLTPLKSGEAFAIASAVFKPKSSTIEADGAQRLEDIVTVVRQNPKLTLEITVYPDATIKNKKQVGEETLLAARAVAVRSFLMSRGMNENQFVITQNKTTPTDGKFAMEITEVKKKKQIKKTVMVPQYIRVVGKVG
ncbi:MAG TPA: carboxypeptidase regulatory-like domain-containing protein [Candidatus Kapabacteria bacterium]|nr:carboxypeptidase regulatory-like domain-containing protein [Candidatus Kapabacteria bacterium]